jgi:Txe/YoeB family toxin of Txe-Axe toxin-antitoxin module
MPFNELEIKHIEGTVGNMCGRRSPEQFKDKLRLVYEVKGHDVTVYEERPHWDRPQEWSRLPVAKFKYSRKDNIWKLYWMRRDLKWHLYKMSRPTKRLESLVKEVDSDPHGAFFG